MSVLCFALDVGLAVETTERERDPVVTGDLSVGADGVTVQRLGHGQGLLLCFRDVVKALRKEGHRSTSRLGQLCKYSQTLL